MVANATSLWSSHFRPHAATVFSQCGRTDRARHARRAAKWLKAFALEQVGREELRREALGRAVDAGDTDRVIQWLEQGGVLRLSAVILWRDELAAWLANLGRYASGGSDRAQWLEAWAAAGVTITAARAASRFTCRTFR